MKAISISKLGLSFLGLLLSAHVMAADPIKTCDAEFKIEGEKESFPVQVEIYKNKGSSVAKITEIENGKPSEPHEAPVSISKFKIRPNLKAAIAAGRELNEGEMQLFAASQIKDAELAVAKADLNFDVNKVRSITLYSFGEGQSTALVEAYDKAGKSLGSYLMVMLSLAPCK